MLFSAKISNSFFVFLDRKRLSREQLDAVLEVPEEFLRNPSSWMDAGRLENFLFEVIRIYGDVIQEVGLASPELRAWGVLDGVLRMMSSPQDLFQQPDRILSYFISPAPVIKNVKREKDSLSFDAPFSAKEFPLCAAYLLSAIESLPIYMGRPPVQVKWSQDRVEINFAENQQNLFGNDGGGQQISPQFLQSLVHSLEKSQKELEERNRELLEQSQELILAQKELKNKARAPMQDLKFQQLLEATSDLDEELNTPLGYVTNHLLRLSDYMARAQQLVTILVGQDRMTAQVREAMRRMDWEFITKEYPKVVREASESLQKVRDVVHEVSHVAAADNSSLLSPNSVQHNIERDTHV